MRRTLSVIVLATAAFAGTCTALAHAQAKPSAVILPAPACESGKCSNGQDANGQDAVAHATVSEDGQGE
ncbi:hypothetical protein [Saccharopolyspora phatthalungensis]|uniref:Secreted protein n=1 Tax=Saccharopolyspora phatthalungensis TaxID=664693 RepID=A0A840QBW3_9PSEU|nr:hypothetical protein [Saccharopolyspora phatthalungensis]MBB5158234.1 hypothetical protein [Saccharopolyspora phatthalungensis]